MLHQILEEERFNPRRLEIKVTESVLMEHLDSATRIFQSLHHIGVRIALDDFGIGYSSLSYLHRFTFDKFKIDGPSSPRWRPSPKPRPSSTRW